MGIFSAIGAGLGIASAAADLFGDSDADRASQRQSNQAREQIDFAREQNNIARQDVNRLYPQAREVTRQGMRSAIDVTRNTPRAQIEPLQQAAMGAQNQILGGVDAFTSAILGGPVNMPQAQQVQASYRPFSNYFMPDFLQPPEPVQPSTNTRAQNLAQGLQPGDRVQDYRDLLGGWRSLQDTSRGRFPW